MKRSKERLEEIDKYLDEHYTKDGGRVCSDALSEKIGYISSRVQMRKNLNNTKNDKKPESKSMIAILSGKVTAKNREIEHLWELLRKQRELNSELRKENIRLINEKIKARHNHAEKTV